MAPAYDILHEILSPLSYLATGDQRHLKDLARSYHLLSKTLTKLPVSGRCVRIILLVGCRQVVKAPDFESGIRKFESSHPSLE